MKKVFGVIAAFIIECLILIGIFYSGCLICATMINYPLVLVVALIAEAVIFVPWEIESRKNRRDYYEKGGKR